MLWVYGVISNHIPPGHTHTFLIRLYLQSVLTELLILQEQLFSLFFLDSSIIALNRFHGRRMIICARVSQKRQKLSPKIHTCANDFCFSTPYYCTANPPTDHSQQHVLQFIRQCSNYMSSLSANRQHPPKIQARKAAINGSTTCGCGLLRSDQISHQKPLSFFFPEVLYEMCFWCSSSP